MSAGGSPAARNPAGSVREVEGVDLVQALVSVVPHLSLKLWRWKFPTGGPTPLAYFCDGDPVAFLAAVPRPPPDRGFLLVDAWHSEGEAASLDALITAWERRAAKEGRTLWAARQPRLRPLLEARGWPLAPLPLLGRVTMPWIVGPGAEAVSPCAPAAVPEAPSDRSGRLVSTSWLRWRLDDPVAECFVFAAGERFAAGMVTSWRGRPTVLVLAHRLMRPSLAGRALLRAVEAEGHLRGARRAVVVRPVLGRMTFLLRGYLPARRRDAADFVARWDGPDPHPFEGGPTLSYAELTL